MTDTPRLDRNDTAILTILAKIADRLETNRADHSNRMAALNHGFLSTNLGYQSSLLASQIAAGVISSSNTYVSGMGAHTHTLGVIIPDWVPSLTISEWKVLKAWANGEDVLLHVLSEER